MGFRYTSLLAGALILMGCEKQLTVTESLNDYEIPAATSAVASAVCDYDLTENTLIASGWSKVFDEPFSNDLSKWNIWYGGAYNNELQLYTANNLQVSDGSLKIIARKEQIAGPTLPGAATQSMYNFSSGRIESKQLFSSSRTTAKVRIAARLKLPRGYGMWPAFWSYGDPWPTQGEIDIMEARGQETDRFSTAYWFGKRKGVNLVTNSDKVIVANTDLAACWHTYEMIWEKSTLTYLLDGVVVDTKTNGYIPDMFGKTQKITLNLAVGGSFFPGLDVNAISPGVFEIDWVKVFTAK